MNDNCVGLCGNLALLGPVVLRRKKLKRGMMLKTAIAYILNCIPVVPNYLRTLHQYNKTEMMLDTENQMHRDVTIYFLFLLFQNFFDTQRCFLRSRPHEDDCRRKR